MLTEEQKEAIKKSFSARGYTVEFKGAYVVLAKEKENIKIPEEDYVKFFKL